MIIQLVEHTAQNGMSFLDINGFSSIGLFVDNIKKYLTKMTEAGFITSAVSSIQVHGRWMDIAFIEGKNGELIELVSIKKEGK